MKVPGQVQRIPLTGTAFTGLINESQLKPLEISYELEIGSSPKTSAFGNKRARFGDLRAGGELIGVKQPQGCEGALRKPPERKVDPDQARCA